MNILIVTPARNEAKNLPFLLDSILRQTSLPPITWVIVDDGSTDDTVEISKKFEAPFKILVLEREKQN